MHPTETTVTGEDLFKKIEGTISDLGLDTKKLRSLTTDCGRNMCGKNKERLGRIREIMKVTGAEEPIFLHCIIH